jgi:crotonobetainyl-CoA:carnitine CoA-transferase CaiB-like acyl-CoA transferase
VQTVRRANGASLRTTRCPIRVDGEILASPRGSPTVGEHTAAVTGELGVAAASGRASP